MAAARREMRAAVQLMGELDRAGQSERFGPVVLYVLLTQDDEALREFGAALRREARRGPGIPVQHVARTLHTRCSTAARFAGRRGFARAPHRSPARLRRLDARCDLTNDRATSSLQEYQAMRTVYRARP